MTKREKEYFITSIIRFLSPPDRGIFAYWKELPPSLQLWIRSSGLPRGIEVREKGADDLQLLSQEYNRLFGEGNFGKVPLVESFYKPWTSDRTCRVPFAGSTGLLMGDSALHMEALYRLCGFEPTAQFAFCPDHLFLELEFLAALYAMGNDEQIATFIGDHLDWIPQLTDKLSRNQTFPFYGNLLQCLQSFLDQERAGV